MRSWLAIWLAIGLGVFAPHARAQTAFRSALGAIVVRHLTNGMTVVVQEDHRTPFVSLALTFVGGQAASMDDPAVAAIETYLRCRHSKHVPSGDYARLLGAAGATGQSDSTWDGGSRLAVTVPSSQLSLPLWLWSDSTAFFSDSIDDADLAKVKAHLAEQRRSAVAASPAARLDSLATTEMFAEGHPRRASYFAAEEVERVDRAALVAYHERWITPSNATLVVVGDVTAADAFERVERYFGPIPHGPDVHLAVPKVEMLRGETQLDVAAAVPKVQISIQWPTPRILTTEDAWLDLVAHVLDGTQTAWLYWKLVDEKKIASRLRVRQRSADVASVFEVWIEGAPGQTPAQLLAGYDAAMGELATRAIPPQSLPVATHELLIDRYTGLEEPRRRAAEMSKFATVVGQPDYFDHDFRRYDATPAQVREAMDKWLPRDRRVVLLVTPTPGAPAGGALRSRRFTPARTP